MTTTIDAASYGLEMGSPAIQSVGPLAFGPDGILFVADNVSAKVFALAVASEDGALVDDVEQLDTRIASFLGCSREDVSVRDMAVHPVTGQVFLAVMRKTGSGTDHALLKLGAEGALAEVGLSGIPWAATEIERAPAPGDEREAVRVLKGGTEGQVYTLPNGTEIRVLREPLRTVTVTDLAYADGMLLVAGASNEEFASSFRRIPFPFGQSGEMNSLEIFHVSHGRYETASPISTFLPYGNGDILASYTCTPLVHFSLASAEAGEHVKGKSVADLGPGNTPIDMVAFNRDGEEYLLVSHAIHPLMKLARTDIERQDALVEQADHVGAAREELSQQNVSYMGNRNGTHVVMLQRDDAEHLNLRAYSVGAL
jgi:hypothetical protein